MQKFSRFEGLVVPMDRANVDTDMIIPKQFLKSIKRTGFGVNLFDELRYLDEGVPDADNRFRPINPEFVLNQPRYHNAQVLIARANFGCGSSREHAPWALLDYSFRCVIAPSFADIFFNNCFKNGILPITLDDNLIDQLFKDCEQHEGFSVTVDLVNKTILTSLEQCISFDVDDFRRHCLLNGLDDIGLTLEEADTIKQFERQHLKKYPWLSQA